MMRTLFPKGAFRKSPRRRGRLAPNWLIVSAFAVGCAVPTETMTLDFPSSDLFVLSQTAEVFIVPLADDDLDACPRLLSDVEVAALDGASTGSADVCEFRDQAVEYPDAPEGAVAYVAVARTEAGQVLLSGCTIRNVYVDEAELRIVLAPTEHYRSIADMLPASTCTAAQRCGGGCP